MLSPDDFSLPPLLLSIENVTSKSSPSDIPESRLDDIYGLSFGRLGGH